ncbi:hypothetical protein SAMN05216482_9158 [Streptomyces sp. PAN_FS17]|nr:hypothetical protein SAMN05216482_9158 [Streptomyces sp. PAN_FS17]
MGRCAAGASTDAGAEITAKVTVLGETTIDSGSGPFGEGVLGHPARTARCSVVARYGRQRASVTDRRDGPAGAAYSAQGWNPVLRTSSSAARSWAAFSLPKLPSNWACAVRQ